VSKLFEALNMCSNSALSVSRDLCIEPGPSRPSKHEDGVLHKLYSRRLHGSSLCISYMVVCNPESIASRQPLLLCFSDLI
jgi:hypothetical protein